LSEIDKDEYFPGEFEIDGLTLQGNIVYNKKAKNILLLIQRKTDGLDRLHFNYHETIIGHLTSGSTVSLIYNNCVQNTTHLFSHQDIVYRSEYLVMGSPNRKFDQMICILENALQWSKMSQLNTEGFIEAKMQYCEERVFNWYGAEIAFSTELKNSLWTSPRPEVCSVEERLQVRIQFKEKVHLKKLLEVRDRIIALISFATKDNVNVLTQFLVDTDDCEEYTEDYKEPHRYELLSTEPNYAVYNTHHFEYNFDLTKLSDNTDIQENLEKLVPIINLYLSLYKYPHMPVEMVFLNLTQALETLHARFFYHNDKDEYIKSVYSRFSNHPQFDHIKSLLLSNGQDSSKCRQIYLISRINDLILGDYDPLFWSFYRKGSTFAQQIVDTRNYYTHYDETKKEKALSGDTLVDAIFILRLILELYTCRFLGVDVKDDVGRRLSNYKNSFPQVRDTFSSTRNSN